METVLNFISDKPWFGVIAAVIAGAAAFCAATPTPESRFLESKDIWSSRISRS